MSKEFTMKMLNTILKLSLLVSLLSASAIAATMMPKEVGIDRKGGENNYKDFDLPSANAQLCEDMCASDGQCKAWTYVSPGNQGNNARCWLKNNNVPIPTSLNYVISGVKLSAPQSMYSNGMSQHIVGIDHFGNDINSEGFSVPIDDPDLCKNTCAGESNCLAWSYRDKVCWIKHSVSEPIVDSTIVSGVKNIISFN